MYTQPYTYVSVFKKKKKNTSTYIRLMVACRVALIMSTNLELCAPRPVCNHTVGVITASWMEAGRLQCSLLYATTPWV